MTHKWLTNKTFEPCPLCGLTVEPEETYQIERAIGLDGFYLHGRFMAHCVCGCNLDRVFGTIVESDDHNEQMSKIRDMFELLEDHWNRKNYRVGRGWDTLVVDRR